MVISKQSIGIDVSKDSFHAQILRKVVGVSGFERYRGMRKFKNNQLGFEAFDHWIKKYTVPNVELTLLKEATGVYHENLAYYLHAKSYYVVIELPTKLKAFARSLNQRTKTDRADTQVIAQMALERDLRRWIPVSKHLRELRSLTRNLQSVIESRTVAKNQLHAIKHSAYPVSGITKRYQELIQLYDEQEETISEEIEGVMKRDDELTKMINHLRTLPCVGLRTAAIVVAETGGFQLFESRAQLLKYAGMDIREKQSGSSVRGKSSMSKAGNSRIRRALYMPSLRLTRGDTVFSHLYSRVADRTGIKLKGMAAVQRKLLIVMYALAKSKMDYCAELHQLRVERSVDEPELAYCDSVS